MYGSPRQLGTQKNPIYGAGLKRPEDAPTPPPASRDEIKAAVIAFAEGYYRYQNCRQFGVVVTNPASADLVIAVGISNSSFVRRTRTRQIYHVVNPALTREHGQDWARLMTEIRADLLRRRYRGITVAGAYDAEPDFWYVDTDGDGRDEPFSKPTFDWARGYDSVAGRPAYYNFGSTDGGLRDSSWLAAPTNQRFEEVFELSWGIGAARPLPQIYTWAYAKEWYQLKRYARVKKGRVMTIAGTMTQAQSSNVDVNKRKPWQEFLLSLPNSPQDFENFRPQQGWQSLYDTLNRTLGTNQGLIADLTLTDSFLVAPGTQLSVRRKPGCFPRTTTYPATALLARGTCLPTGTIFPTDSTFAAPVAVPPAFSAAFSQEARQSQLRWSTDIAFGRWN